MKTDQLRKQAESFECELERETARLKEAQDQVEHVSREIGEADPDAESFGKLVLKREAAKARVEALGVRVQRATELLAKARTELARVEAADKVEAARMAMQAVVAAGREMNRVAASARSKIEFMHRDFIKAVDAAVAAYNALPTAELRDEVGLPGNHSPWAQLFLGNDGDILEAAARLSRKA